MPYKQETCFCSMLNVTNIFVDLLLSRAISLALNILKPDISNVVAMDRKRSVS